MTEITQTSSSFPTSGPLKNEIYATTAQIGFLNSHLPFGYRLELFEDFQNHASSRGKSSKNKKTVSFSLRQTSKKRSFFTGLDNDIESNKEDHLGSQRASKRLLAPKSTRNELSRIDPITGQRIANTEAEIYIKCEKVITALMNDPSAQYFVNSSGHNVPGSMSAPIDLNVISKRLAQGHYLNVPSFAADVRKIWENSWSAADPGTEVYIATTAMSETFENLMNEVKNRQPSKQNTKKPKISNSKGASSKNSGVKPMTMQEKSILRQNIMRLNQSKMQGLVEIIQPVIDTKKAKESLEFDLDKLPVDVCRKLEVYVNSCHTTKQTTKESKPVPQDSFVILYTDIQPYAVQKRNPMEEIKEYKPQEQGKGSMGISYMQSNVPVANTKPDGKDDDSSSESGKFIKRIIDSDSLDSEDK